MENPTVDYWGSQLTTELSLNKSHIKNEYFPSII